MQVKVSLKRRCDYCQIVKRRNKIYVVCTTRKHKQRQK